MKSNMLITGTSRGIGRYLAEYYSEKYNIIGCSRNVTDYLHKNYTHYKLDITNEDQVNNMFTTIQSTHGNIDILINNAGIASMNHALLTPLKTAEKIFSTNVLSTFLLCREAAKLMQRNRFGRIINFVTVAIPFELEGESLYAASKSAVLMLTRVLSKEFAPFGITVNAIGPCPVKTDLIKNVPVKKIEHLIKQQAIKRYGELTDISNITNFFIQRESDMVTGQVIYLAGA
jgi:3-oxoacyl-[acyl-carrier protein] reductase